MFPRDEWTRFRRYRRSETPGLLLSIIAIFVAIFVAAALFVGPEIALARARVLGRWVWGITFGLAVVVAFIAFVFWEIIKFWQASRDPDSAARDPGAWLGVSYMVPLYNRSPHSYLSRAAK